VSLLIFYMFLALIVSFFAQFSEAVLFSVRPSYIAAMDQSSRAARTLKMLRDNLDMPLAAILTAKFLIK